MQSKQELPFALETNLQLPVDLTIRCRLRLTDAADADKRDVSFSTEVTLSPASRRSQAASHSCLFSYITQVRCSTASLLPLVALSDCLLEVSTGRPLR